MDRASFDMHTTDKVKKRAFRTEYLPNIFEVAQKPDEVWLGRDSTNKQQKDMSLSNYTLIKYYKGSAIVVSCKIENDTLVFKTWYQLKDKNKRKGLLLKKGIQFMPAVLLIEPYEVYTFPPSPRITSPYS